jgi:hypothetical protein
MCANRQDRPLVPLAVTLAVGAIMAAVPHGVAVTRGCVISLLLRAAGGGGGAIATFGAEARAGVEVLPQIATITRLRACAAVVVVTGKVATAALVSISVVAVIAPAWGSSSRVILCAPARIARHSGPQRPTPLVVIAHVAV